MKRVWNEIAQHRGISLLCAGYWLATVAVRYVWREGVLETVGLLSNCVLWGAVISWWRGQSIAPIYPAARRIAYGMVAGVLAMEITFLAAGGGVVYELIGTMRGLPHYGHVGEAIGVTLFFAPIGGLLGSIGAAVVALLQRFVFTGPTTGGRGGTSGGRSDGVTI